MRKSIGLCSWRALAGGLAVGVIAWSVSVDAASRNAGARDKGQVKSASRLVTGPVNQVGEQIRNQGGVATGALIEFKWLDAQGVNADPYPSGTSGVDTADLTIPGAGPNGQRLWLGVFLSGWPDFDNDDPPVAAIFNWQATLANLPAGISVFRLACPGDDDQLCKDEMGEGAGAGCNITPITDDTCAPAFRTNRTDKIPAGPDPGDPGVGPGLGIGACSIASDNIGCGQGVTPDNDPFPNPGGVFYGATFTLLAAQSLVGGPHTIDFVAPNGLTFMNDGFVDVKVTSATLSVETGSCCFGIAPGQTASCEENVSRTDCESRAPANSFRSVNLCPANGGAACAECFNPGQPDPACADPVAGVTGDNQCTENNCDANQICQNPDIAGWDRADDCCDPVDASFTALDDGVDCTDDSCSLGSGLGVAEHDNSQAGSSCDDGNACTHSDVCGDKDAICTGLDINLDDCNDNETCEALIQGVFCDTDAKKCSCSLNPDMTCDITPGKLPKHAECIGGVRDGEKCESDDDCAGQENPPIFAGFCDNQACFHENEKVEGFVHIGPALVAINGFQVTVNYDPSCMQLQSVGPVAPYVQVLDTQIDEVAGEIFMAAGVAFGAGNGPFGDTDLMRITWIKTGECSTCNCSFGGANPVNTYLTDADGQPLNVLPEPSQTVVSAGLLSLDIPPSVKSNVACDALTADLTWDPPSAADTCGVQQFACAAHHAQKGKIIDDLIMGGGAHAIGDSTYCCWATNKCGAFVGFQVGNPQSNSAEGCWTVTVNDQTALDIEIELSPTMSSKAGEGVVRCIEFEAFSNCVQGPLVFCDNITFGGNFHFTGHHSGTFKMPPGQFACLTARDKLHSLRSCALRSDGNLDCVGGTVFATFKGDPFFGGNWLINGNLDAWKKDNADASHDVIDIQDFGQFVANYLQCYFDGEKVSCSSPTNGNTPCSGTDHKDFDCHAMSQTNADINGDGIADLLDFAFVSFNFLVSSKDCCCPGSTGNTVGRTAISVVELRQMGLSDLIVADLNNDGMLDLNDMSAFLSGEVPSRKGIQHRSGLRSTGRK